MKVCSTEKAVCYSRSRILMWIKTVDYKEELEDLDMARHLIDDISPLAIACVQHIRTSSFFNVQRFLKFENI